MKQSFIWKKLLRDFGKDWIMLVIAGLLTLAQVLLSIYFPVLIGRAIDSVLIVKSNHILPRLLGLMFLILLLNAFVQWLLPIILNRVVYAYTYRLREGLIQKIHQLPMGYFHELSVGDLVSRVTTDSEQLANGLILFFNQFFLGFLTIILTIVMMLRVDFAMTLITVFLTPLSLYLARFIAKKSYHFYQEQTQQRGLQTQFIDESLTQVTLIHSFGAQSQMTANFEKVNNRYAQASQAAIFYSSIVNPSTRFINALIYLSLVGLGAMRIMSGQISVGQLTTFLNYVNQYTKPFNDISSVLSEMQSSLACAERLYGILEKDSLVDSHASVNVSDFRGRVYFDQVSFGYVPDKILIKNLNLDVKAGSRVAIVGPTGAGKSTLINLLMRFYEPNSGRILLDDQDLASYKRSDLYEQMGMVLQDTWLKSATIHDNIAYGRPDATRAEVIAAAQSANADFFIRQLPDGYDTFLVDGGADLSQGQRQLLAIARVFLKAPRLLILDEATSSIDTRTEVLVQEAFENLMKDRTSFVIAHRLSTIRKADVILVMVDGQVVEQGTHESLMAAKGVYYDMNNS